jgi:SAM-dependent methyltransferase
MSTISEAIQPALGHREAAGACVLCGRTNGPVVVAENGYRGRACTCGVVYIDPRPAPDALNPAEDHHLETYYSLPAKVRLDWMARFKSSGRLLEVGCGGGQFLALAKAHGYQVSAVEPNPESAQIAARSLGIEVERALIEESALPPKTFDVVFHVDLLSHFPDPVRALRKMAELVRSDGVVCFEVGVFGGLAAGWYPWVGRIGYPQHLWLYSEAAIRAVLERSGLRVEAVRRFGLLPATILSTVGNRSVRRKLSRPSSDKGRAARATGFYRAYSWLQYMLRYRVGRFVPPIGPYAMLVAARPLQHEMKHSAHH